MGWPYIGKAAKGDLAVASRDSTRNWTSMVLFPSLSTRMGKPERGGAQEHTVLTHSDTVTHTRNHASVNLDLFPKFSVFRVS